jgi:hypothetical protein
MIEWRIAAAPPTSLSVPPPPDLCWTPYSSFGPCWEAAPCPAFGLVPPPACLDYGCVCYLISAL